MKNQYIFSFIIIFFTLQLFAQGGDNAASASGTPITLPFNANGTTVGRTDNYNNVSVMGNVGFTSGPDWLYYFCATSSTVITYTLTFTPDATNGVWPSISVWQSGAPGAGTLVAQNAVVGDVETNMTGSFAITTGQCYYVMVDNWPTPNGFAYNLDLSLPPAEPALTTQPSCTNIGFDAGSFTGWSGGWSNNVTTNSPGQPTPIFFPTTFNTSTAQHTITSGAATDPLAGFPQVCPGMGANSVRLGDGAVAGNGGSMLTQKFAVTSSNALFTYYYAVVITDAYNPVYYQAADGSDSVDASGNFVVMPNWNNTGDSILRHLSEEQPFFKVELFDNGGNPLACGNYLVVGGEGIPGFTQIGTSSVYYKNWTPVFIDLTPFIGSNVTVRFTVADCSLGAHYCYAYLDAVCEPMVIIGPTNICPNGTGTLTSPLGGSAYSWSDLANPGTEIGTTQSISVSPTAATTTYQCIVTSVTGCSTTLTFTVNLYPVTTLTATNDTICNGQAGTIVATGSPTGAGNSFSWSPSGVATASLTQSPTATTTYTCTYVDPNGCSTTGTGTIVVNPLPVAPTTAPVVYCQNDVAVSLTATPTAGCTLNWYGTNATGGTASSTAPTPITTAAGTTTYYVSQTTVQGCEGPRAPLTVTVNALPVITVNSPTICPNATAVLTATGGTTYEWDGNPALTANPYTVTPTATTTYTVVGTTSGCSNTATATVTVSNILAVSVNSPTICNGGTALLTASGATTYEWDGNPALTANPYSVTPTTTTTYTVEGTTNGCTGTATATVTVNPVPTTTAGSNSPICAGTALNLTATTSSVAGATYSWTGPNSFTSALQNPTIASSTTAATGVYTVTVTAAGCSSTSTVNVTVNAIPTTTASSNSPICDGATINLTATNSTVAGSTYSWTGPNAFTSALQNPSILAATMTASGAYTVTVLANGCSSTSTTNVVVNPIPTTTAGSNSPICNGATLSLTATASGVAGSTYSWTGPNAFTSAVQNPSITSVTTAASGSYIVTVSANGCTSTSTVVVVVNQTPSTVAGSTPVCQGSDLSLTATASGVVGSTYSWTGPNGFTSLLQNPTVTAAPLTASGIYTVTVTAAGCSSNSTVNAVVNAPITPAITISPNTICEGSVAPILLSASFDNPPITGTWSPNSVSVTATGTYIFTPDPGQCALPVSQTVTVNPLPVLVITDPADFCVPLTTNLTAAAITAGSTGGGTLSYWMDAACTVPLSNPSAVGVGGTYFINSTAAGCSTVEPVTVIVHPLPIAAFTPMPSEVSNLNPYSVMQNNSVGAVSYWWDFGDDTPSSTLTNPDHYFPDADSGTYLITLVATTEYGCVDTAYASVLVNEELIFYVPNTFTPDKDAFNETFLPVFTSGYDPYDYTLYIYNRWGELIFESHDVNVGWKGTYGPDQIKVQDDTYTWKIVFKLKMNKQHKVVVGHVNVLR